jgi:hypothetical protein
MKTAEEYLALFEAHPNEPDLYHKAYVLTAMQAFAREACREQREICAEEYTYAAPYTMAKIELSIKNAPEPKMI